MEWNPQDTVTVGGIIAGIIFLLLAIIRMVGQRTDPQLVALFKAQTDANAKAEARMAAAVDRLTDTMAITLAEYSASMKELKEGVNTVFAGVVQLIEKSEANATARQIEVLEVWKSFRVNVKKEHDDTYTKILEIAPKIDELKQEQQESQIQSEGFKRVMDDAITSASKTNGEILAALKRVEQGQDRIQSVFQELLESNRRNEKLMQELMEKPRQDINAVKAEFVKSKEQPVTPATKTEEKEKTDD